MNVTAVPSWQQTRKRYRAGFSLRTMRFSWTLPRPDLLDVAAVREAKGTGEFQIIPTSPFA
jgi:hypothetical protein